jgi:monoamine oxidase
MNERPEAASALLFARAMRRAFFGKDADSRMLIPTVGQTELYVSGALGYLRSRGSLVRTNAGVAAVLAEGRRATGVRLRDGAVVRAGSVVPTAPPWALAGLLPPGGPAAEIRAAAQGVSASPIVSATLWYDRPFMEGTALGLIGKRFQWVFNRRALLGEGNGKGGCVSCVISAAREEVRMPAGAIASLAAEELRSVFPSAARSGLVHAVVVKEKRATFSPTPGTEERRPPTETPVGGLFLAGDWTDTGLPATIEGAVASGYAAAARVLRG